MNIFKPLASVAQVKKEKYWPLFRTMTENAAHGRHPIVYGKALGPDPKYFIVGDEPGVHDYYTGEPFSGARSGLLTSTLETLYEKYDAKPEDCYITYFVKTTFLPGDLTIDLFTKEWLPALQLEYAMSGCTDVVALTEVVQQFAGYIPQRPATMDSWEPTMVDRLKTAWSSLNG